MKIVLLGEQATGKSSLLVALYGALVHHRAGEMRIVRTDDDVEFLSRGLEALGRFESVHRTAVDADARVALEVSRGVGTVAIELPDRSGDQLRNMIDTRLWDPQLQRNVVEADGAMLFLRADWLLDDAPKPTRTDAFEQPLAIDDPPAADERFSAWGDPPTDDPFIVSAPLEADAISVVSPDGRPEADEHASADPFARPWDADGQGGDEHADEGAETALAPDLADNEPQSWAPSRMPVDVRAVDLLQELLEERSTRLPLAVIVSAWDRVGDATIPTAWLAEQLPLLEQFLASNSGQLPRAVFGVSAQGADFGEHVTGGRELYDPWDRAYLVRPDGSRGTVAEPIEWLINAAA